MGNIKASFNLETLRHKQKMLHIKKQEDLEILLENWQRPEYSELYKGIHHRIQNYSNELRKITEEIKEIEKKIR